ncbi:hypothetical protein P7C70_g9186, partial [Phenoliferia sp. Uapishka_3]
LTGRSSHPTPVRPRSAPRPQPTSTPTPAVEGIAYFDDVTTRDRNRNSATGKLGRVASLIKVLSAFDDPFPTEEALNRYITAQILVDAEANDIPFRGLTFTHTDKDRRAVGDALTSSRGLQVRFAREFILGLFNLADDARDADYLREEVAWLLDSRFHFANTPSGMTQLDPAHPRYRPYQNKSLVKFVATIRKRVTGDSDRQSVTPEFVGLCMAMTGTFQLVHFTGQRYAKYVTDIASNMRKVSFANTPWMNLGGILAQFNDAAFPVAIESADPNAFVCYDEDSGEEEQEEDEPSSDGHSRRQHTKEPVKREPGSDDFSKRIRRGRSRTHWLTRFVREQATGNGLRPRKVGYSSDINHAGSDPFEEDELAEEDGNAGFEDGERFPQAREEGARPTFLDMSIVD